MIDGDVLSPCRRLPNPGNLGNKAAGDDKEGVMWTPGCALTHICHVTTTYLSQAYALRHLKLAAQLEGLTRIGLHLPVHLYPLECRTCDTEIQPWGASKGSPTFLSADPAEPIETDIMHSGGKDTPVRGTNQVFQ